MAVSNMEVKQKLALTLNASSLSNIIPFFTYTPYAKAGYRLLDEYIEINNVKAISWLYNITPVQFPVFSLEDSESQQIFTAIDLEWNSPRIQLDVLLKIDGSNTWQQIDSKSLLNMSPYPYREFELGNHALGNNSMLGFQIVDTGSGILKETLAGKDKVVITADMVRQVFLQELLDNSSKIVNNISTIASTIVNSNPNRKGLTMLNTSTTTIYIDSVSTVSSTSYIARLLPGAYYEAPSPIYTGVYYAKTASGTVAIEIREYS